MAQGHLALAPAPRAREGINRLLPLQGEGWDGVALGHGDGFDADDGTHPHLNPPLEGEESFVNSEAAHLLSWYVRPNR